MAWRLRPLPAGPGAHRLGGQLLRQPGGHAGRSAAAGEDWTTAADEAEKTRLRGLQGKLAIANAKIAYRDYRDLFGSARFQKLAALGARPQRLLWASTSTKNPAYRDVIYVEELIGGPTVNTMPPQTVQAFQEHGRLRDSLAEDPAGAEALLEQIEAAGLDVDAITDQLLAEGVASFAQSFNELVAAVQPKSRVKQAQPQLQDGGHR